MSEIPMYPSELDCPCGIGEHANPWQCAAHLRERLEVAERKLSQIRVILENYADDEHFSAWNAVGAIEELKP